MTDQSSYDDFLRARAMLRRNMLRNWALIIAAAGLGLYCIAEQLAVFTAINAVIIADLAYLNGRMQGMLDLADGPA